jgi:predicted DNA-binding protein YlxM (UPF0122 family)
MSYTLIEEGDAVMMEHVRLEKTLGLALLSDIYGPLLTEKQRQALSLFYDEDFSLSEIAAECACSRQAAHELIKRSEALLKYYEQKLGLVARYQQLQSLFKQAEQELSLLGLTREQEEFCTFRQIWRKLEKAIND